VINWGGIHGSIPVALALGLPEMPERTFIVNLVFGIVFLSLTVQGLTVSPLVRALGLGGRVEEEEQYERAVARSIVIRRALDELKYKLNAGRVTEKIYDRVALELEEDLRVIESHIEELGAHPHVQRSWENRTRQATLTLQKSTLYEMMIQGDLSHEAAEELMGEVDLRLEKLESEEEEEI
jgi:CPA1 family monovalent cation:H+ antiporter